jgi:hypothetical protein
MTLTQIKNPRTRRAVKQALDEAKAATDRREDKTGDSVCAEESPQPAPALAVGRARKQKGSLGGSSGPRYHATYYLYSNRPYDVDNFAGSVKAIQDALVDLGWLPDDGWKTLSAAFICRWCPQVEKRIEIVLMRMQ